MCRRKVDCSEDIKEESFKSVYIGGYHINVAVGNKCIDELVVIVVKGVDGRCYIGAIGREAIHLLLGSYTHRTSWLDGTNSLPRDGS